MRSTHRGGFAPIADYAVLSDGRTVALVAADGRIDWLPFPTLDAPPVCAALLDPENGGHISLAPAQDYEAARRYLEGTNVLETVYTTESGKAKVTQALNAGSAGRLPWTELVWRIEGLEGSMDLHWELAPGDRFGRANPWVSMRQGTPIVVVGDQTLGVVAEGDDPGTIRGKCLRGSIRTARGDRLVVAVVGTDREPVFIPEARKIDERLDRTIDSWRRWTSLLKGGSRWQPAVERSALALKSLLCEDSGAIAAAATTSLPERIGGSKNWDYRYSWVRDTSFVLDALINLGLHEEVHGAVSWLLEAVRTNGPDLHIFYTLGADISDSDRTIEVSGYQNSQPVRSGNSASSQTQLGTYGDLFDTVFRYCKAGHHLDAATGQLLAELADRCCDSWHHRDSGIWELEKLEHYTISKIGCWVAFDRAVRLAEVGQIPDDRIDRWRAEKNLVREWVDTHCWSETNQSYTFYAGTEDLDAAVLLAGRTGFDCGARLASTAEAVAAELGRGPYVYRYSGMQTEEGAFVACTFWLIDAFTFTGQTDRACQLMDRAVGTTNDIGLLSEQIDPYSGEFLGNVPQALSHLALINAASLLQRSIASPTPDERSLVDGAA